jgi:hypothetical protein
MFKRKQERRELEMMSADNSFEDFFLQRGLKIEW